MRPARGVVIWRRSCRRSSKWANTPRHVVGTRIRRGDLSRSTSNWRRAHLRRQRRHRVAHRLFEQAPKWSEEDRDESGRPCVAKVLEQLLGDWSPTRTRRRLPRAAPRDGNSLHKSSWRSYRRRECTVDRSLCWRREQALFWKTSGAPVRREIGIPCRRGAVDDASRAAHQAVDLVKRSHPIGHMIGSASTEVLPPGIRRAHTATLHAHRTASARRFVAVLAGELGIECRSGERCESLDRSASLDEKVRDDEQAVTDRPQLRGGPSRERLSAMRAKRAELLTRGVRRSPGSAPAVSRLLMRVRGHHGDTAGRRTRSYRRPYESRYPVNSVLRYSPGWRGAQKPAKARGRTPPAQQTTIGPGSVQTHRLTGR